jgi:hypothetical protein
MIILKEKLKETVFLLMKKALTRNPNSKAINRQKAAQASV